MNMSENHSTFRHGLWTSPAHAHTLAHTYVCILYMHSHEQRHMGTQLIIPQIVQVSKGIPSRYIVSGDVLW